MIQHIYTFHRSKILNQDSKSFNHPQRYSSAVKAQNLARLGGSTARAGLSSPPPQGYRHFQRKHTNTSSLIRTWFKKNKDRSSNRPQILRMYFMFPLYNAGQVASLNVHKALKGLTGEVGRRALLPNSASSDY